jgi:hypothetical protein
MISPRISLFFEGFDLVLEGGYFVSFSRLFTSYPYGFLKIGKEFK